MTTGITAADGGWMDPDVRPGNREECWERIATDPRHYPAGARVPTAQEASSMGRGWRGGKAAVWQDRWFAVYDTRTENGEEQDYLLHIFQKNTLDHLFEFFGSRYGQGVVEHEGKRYEDVAFIPLEFYRESKTLRNRGFTPGSCLYDSTSAYLKSILGIELHPTDRSYFLSHPLLEEHGTPTPFTARVAQEIVQPYGLRVCRIRMCTGIRPMVDWELADWMERLGCNPMAREDHRTTNAEFAALTGQSLETVNAAFAFEYHDEPLKPSVVCEASKAHSLAKPLGHASYLPPRGVSSSWWVSLQYDRSPFPIPALAPQYEPVPVEYDVEPDLWDMKRAVEAHEKYLEEAAKHKEQQERSGSRSAAAAGEVLTTA